MGIKNINKDLIEVIAEGCCVIWGAADLECYARDEETTTMRLIDQYEIEPECARGISEEICKIGQHRAKRQRMIFEMKMSERLQEEEQKKTKRLKREI